MKKILFVLSIAFSFNAIGQANVYHPFPETYGNWWVRTNTYPGGNSSGPILDSLYYTSGDTIVNSLNYKKINCINEGYAHGPIPTIDTIFSGGIYAFSYRNDSINKKVYILPHNKTQEILWYDFNLIVGDTLQNCYATSNNPLIVTSIDSVLICNNYYKRYSVSCASSTSMIRSYYLVESQGLSTNFMSNYFSDYCAFEPYRTCGTNAWSLDYCASDLAGIKNNFNNLYTKIYPNPSTGNFVIETQNTLYNVHCTMYDVTGRIVLAQTINGKTSIDASNLPNGIYNISLTSNEGVVNKRLVVAK